MITAPAFHLGPVRHMEAAEAGYDQEAEDRLLAETPWETDGYRLFEISTPAGSWGRGLFGPAGESSSLFCPRPMWDELGGSTSASPCPAAGSSTTTSTAGRATAEYGGIELVVMLDEGRSTSTTAVRAPTGAATPGTRWLPSTMAITGAHTARPPRPRSTSAGSTRPSSPSSSARPARRSGDWRSHGYLTGDARYHRPPVWDGTRRDQ